MLCISNILEDRKYVTAECIGMALKLLSPFRKVRFSAGTLAILTDVFGDFSQSLQNISE
jgi:hypothetical protein